MLKQIKQFIKRHGLIMPGEQVLVAVSGGADSVALLYALKKLARSLGVTLTVAHLNHCIRGAAADDDADFVKALAARMNIPLAHGRSDVPRRARAKGVSLEMAAREARYAFFARAAKKAGAQVVATAHTADDQAETVLLKLARGAGPRGLSGIPRRNTLGKLRVVRPMLELTRQDILAFLRENNIAWREDESNRDVSFLRNMIRHQLLPLLESKVNSEVRRALVRVAEILREEDLWLDDISKAIFERCVSRERLGDFAPCALDIPGVMRRPIAARRRVLRIWLAACGVPPDSIGFDAVSRMEALMEKRKGSGMLDIAGNWTVERRYRKLMIRAGRTHRTESEFCGEVRVPGETVLPDIGLRIITSREPGITKEKTRQAGAMPAAVSISPAAIGKKKLFVRSWRPGDRMKPFGMTGTKKLQDVFVDTKTPADRRKSAPVFECGSQIVWLPGYRVARGWEVKGSDSTALQIRVERV